MSLGVPPKVSREPGLLPALLTLGSNRNRRRPFSALYLGEPAAVSPAPEERAGFAVTALPGAYGIHAQPVASPMFPS